MGDRTVEEWFPCVTDRAAAPFVPGVVFNCLRTSDPTTVCDYSRQTLVTTLNINGVYVRVGLKKCS
jgi:hypothetical protein